MTQSSRMLALLLLIALFFETSALAIGPKNTGYKGGTVPGFEGAKDEIEGMLDTTNSDQLVFTAMDKPFKGKTFSIPYKGIVEMQFGQKVGLRVGTAIASTVILGPIGMLSLLNKKRQFYLAIGYKDDADKEQVAVLELGKEITGTTIAIIETRSGKKVEYQDEEARKAAQ